MSLLPAKVQRRKPDFTLTMVNIVFLLLLFFLTTGSLTNREEAQSAVPVTSTLPLEKLPRPLLLLESDGRLFLDGKLITRPAVVESAKTALAAAPEGATLNLLAQRDMAVPLFLSVAGDLRAAGLSVNVVTLRRGPEAGD